MNSYECEDSVIPNLRKSCCIVRVSGFDNISSNNSNNNQRSRSFSYSSNGKIVFSCSGFIIDLEKGLIITSPTIFLPFIQQQIDQTTNIKKNNSNGTLDLESTISINTKYSIEKILSNINIDVILESDIVNLKNNNNNNNNDNEDNNNSNSNINTSDKIYDPINSWKSCRFLNFLSCNSNTLNVLNQLKNHFILSNQSSGYESSFGLIVLELIDKSQLMVCNTYGNGSGSSDSGINKSVMVGNSIEEKSGNSIYVVGSPFGFISPTMFLNSISNGIICNCISSTNNKNGNGNGNGNENASMFLIDARSLPGNEGSAVFNKDGLLIGMVAPPIRSKNDKLPFTLAPVLPIHCFLPRLESQLSIHPQYNLTNMISTQNSLNDTVIQQSIQNSIVLVQFKNSWGSGVLISDTGYILTNAHLIIPSIPLIQQLQQVSQSSPSSKSYNNNNNNNNQSFPTELYKDKKVDIRINCNSIIKQQNQKQQHFQSSSNYIWCKGSIEYISHTHLDIALIKIDLNNEIFNNYKSSSLVDSGSIGNGSGDSIIKFHHVKYNSTMNTPKYGESVFVLGFPLIPPTQTPSISITKGIISNIVFVDNCAVSYQTTASVHSGNSGGGLFDRKGNFLGIVTCNAKQKNGLIITELNFSIPSISLIHFFHYANGIDPMALNLMKLTTTNKFLKALWKLQITPPLLTNNIKNNNNNNNNGNNNNINNISTTTPIAGKKYSEFLSKINEQYQQQQNNNIQSKL